MINTINISLPSQLKSEAEKLVQEGYYASFSDLVRTSLRKLLETKYDRWANQAVKDEERGKLKALETNKQIDRYLNDVVK